MDSVANNTEGNNSLNEKYRIGKQRRILNPVGTTTRVGIARYEAKSLPVAKPFVVPAQQIWGSANGSQTACLGDGFATALLVSSDKTLLKEF
jgi:hypothetical protein